MATSILHSLNAVNDTDSSNTATGAIVTAGGIGVAKQLNVGGAFSCGTNSATVGALSSAAITSTGAIDAGTNSVTCGSATCGALSSSSVSSSGTVAGTELQCRGTNTTLHSVKLTNETGATTYGDMAYAGATNNIMTGTTQGDVVVRNADNTKALHLGCGSGYASMVVTNSSIVCNPLTVNGTTMIVKNNAQTSYQINDANGNLKCEFGRCSAGSQFFTQTAPALTSTNDVVLRNNTGTAAVHLGVGATKPTLSMFSDLVQLTTTRQFTFPSTLTTAVDAFSMGGQEHGVYMCGISNQNDNIGALFSFILGPSSSSYIQGLNVMSAYKMTVAVKTSNRLVIQATQTDGTTSSVMAVHLIRFHWG